MNMGIVIDILRTSIYEIVIIGAPLLLAPMIIGLIVSIFQATTQIQEQTLTFVPKMIAIFAVVAILGPWMITRLINYINYLINIIPNAIK
ncbi:MAG: flagellar biosynthesis protein FliQ [Spirochaetes bacterium]|nr:flagellar biosynthesis protein FliQ [Spirochaetota bacterium]NLJ05119.1 flagellar biosynthesis protein FliQ [Exilispira sp.]MBP8991213.1 flagellar biosynthesis protein FliQ [Spirochaetota bacterium]HNV43727.1 flagellar biosynthesis protein FliQ [Exilispira sp.]HOV46377.1 flagellar biosynthesis protein FliQ [Exilispira sp.]